MHKILASKNHVATPQISKILIGLFNLTKEYSSKEINVQIFNNILLKINSIKLRQIIFLPISRENNGNYFSFKSGFKIMNINNLVHLLLKLYLNFLLNSNSKIRIYLNYVGNLIN